MPFDWDEIQREWLYGLPVTCSQETIIKAFKKVEERFGETFFRNYRWIRGTYIITLILDLSRILEEVERGHCELPQYGEVIRNIKANNIHLVDTVTRLAAFYLRHDLPVEFEPEIVIRRKVKRPDFRVEFSQKWIYIEESKFDVSKHQELLTFSMEEISSVLDKVEANVNIKVSLLKDNISRYDINRITGKIASLSSMDQPQTSKIEGLAQILTHQKGENMPSFEEILPALCVSSLVVGGGYERHLDVEVPFTDIRIQKIMKESKHLSKKEENMIILDISIPGNLKRWSESVRRLMNQNQHRVIGAILLVEKHQYIKSLEVHVDLVEHPNHLKPLPKEFIQLTNDFYDRTLKYNYRP